MYFAMYFLSFQVLLVRIVRMIAYKYSGNTQWYISSSKVRNRCPMSVSAKTVYSSSMPSSWTGAWFAGYPANRLDGGRYQPSAMRNIGLTSCEVDGRPAPIAFDTAGSQSAVKGLFQPHFLQRQTDQDFTTMREMSTFWALAVDTEPIRLHLGQIRAGLGSSSARKVMDVTQPVRVD